MIDSKLEICKIKLDGLSKDEKLKMIYMWVKQGHINLSYFKKLLELL